MSGTDDRRTAAGADAPDEPFLKRWARLKRESREDAAGDSAVPAGPPAAPGADPESKAAEESAGGEVSDAGPSGLPPLESLTEESDFGAFMRAGVDPDLRRQALRKMFRNPKYAVVDELDPYRADFAAFTPLGDIVTADMRFHAERLLRKQMEKAAEAAGDARGEGPEAGEPGAEGPDDVRAAEAGREAREPDGPVAADDAAEPEEEADERRDT